MDNWEQNLMINRLFFESKITYFEKIDKLLTFTGFVTTRKETTSHGKGNIDRIYFLLTTLDKVFP